ncbi:putative U-box domain-containing protein 50 isoform X1 [Glycine soja]|uniref:RING-type E3 ubiquitin transferase n=1 Tax=Glycine soja TaxID=3848 RepID=A0A445J3N0_GLYSO|nr:putative U-box domain-containing protein 50 isoform X1 [Glycine soja]RZB92948.1 putative U-box domain-containing protein 50 isoform A [Glycine soja]RZB92950.1 putative U-box domain-containing protein 50 isoform C [Glycine soja]
MDAIQTEKIYVAVGNDVQDGLKTLNWALKKWNSHPISIAVLHVTHNSTKDYVYTPFGKLPARSVSEEKLQILRKDEQDKINKLLSKYIAFCGKVPAEILEVEKFDEPMQKRVIDLIFGLGITKLVMGFSFMKPSMKSKGAISGLFYVHQHKPSFCELFIICGGKQVFLRGKNDEKIMEDDRGVMSARMRDKVTFKDWLDKWFNDKTNDSQDRSTSLSSTNLESPLNQNQWEFYLQEIEKYYQELLSSNLEEGNCVLENDDSQIGPIEPHVTEHNNYDMSAADKIEILKNKLNEAQKIIQLKRKEAKDNIERHTKAEWAICLCNSRAEELESRIREEASAREELKKESDAEKEQTVEMKTELEERKRSLRSLTEVQSELSNRLQIWTLAKTRAETQLEKAVGERSEMVREIEELRRQRDVFNRRIEFCKEKDAIGMAASLAEMTCCAFREYTEEELRLATDNFSDRLRFKSGGDWTNVYRGRFNHSSVAIKMLPSLSHQHFQSKVRLLGDMRQPHLVAMVGFCSEPKCIVLEYMGNGSLRDMLFSRRRNRVLRWHDRIRIATEVCSGLGFLNAAELRPAIHCHLSSSKILLDRNLVAKITGFGLLECHDEQCNVESDLQAIGVLLIHLLTGRNWAGLVEEVMTVDMDRKALGSVLDEMAGQWPLDLARELAALAMRCMSIKAKPNSELSIARVLEELNEIRRNGDEIVEREGPKTIIGGCIDRAGSSDMPSVFLCPILQEAMTNPHVAADGFSYELEAIEHWLQSGRDTSPMTNLRLKHTFLTPNHTLRSLIQDWQTNKST